MALRQFSKYYWDPEKKKIMSRGGRRQPWPKEYLLLCRCFREWARGWSSTSGWEWAADFVKEEDDEEEFVVVEEEEEEEEDDDEEGVVHVDYEWADTDDGFSH
jgi:hypothetical protein